MAQEMNAPSLEQWLYMFVSKTRSMYNSPLWGGNAYLYKRFYGYTCCALLYSKPDEDWSECAARHVFSEAQIPKELVELLQQDEVRRVDVTERLLVFVRLFNAHDGDENMKFNLFKMAQIAQTAMNVADDVNATYNPQYDGENLASFAHDPSVTGSERAMGMARAALNQDWFDLAKLGFDALVNLVSEDPLPYEDYLEAISQYIDVKIQQFSMEEGLKFVGGECSLSVSMDEKKVLIKVQLYFKNSSNKWVMKEITGGTAFNCFTADTLSGEITDLLNEGGRKFPVMAPER